MKALNNAVKDLIEALNHVPAVQLMHIESTLRQLRTDLTNSNLPVLADLDTLIEDAAIAHAEVLEELQKELIEEHYATMCSEAYSCRYCGPITPVYEGDDEGLPF